MKTYCTTCKKQGYKYHCQNCKNGDKYEDGSGEMSRKRDLWGLEKGDLVNEIDNLGEVMESNRDLTKAVDLLIEERDSYYAELEAVKKERNEAMNGLKRIADLIQFWEDDPGNLVEEIMSEVNKAFITLSKQKD